MSAAPTEQSPSQILGKRLEKIISARLVCTLEYQDFDDCPFAYLKKRSSTQAVLALVKMITKNTLNGKVTGVVFSLTSQMPSVPLIESNCYTSSS